MAEIVLVVLAAAMTVWAVTASLRWRGWKKSALRWARIYNEGESLWMGRAVRQAVEIGRLNDELHRLRRMDGAT